MSIRDVVTRGYGPGGSIGLIVKRGFGAEAAASVTADQGGGAWWWWQQQQLLHQQYRVPPPEGTQPGRAYGAEFVFIVEFEPGIATGEAKTKARRPKFASFFEAGIASGAAVAGDASAVEIPAHAAGVEINIPTVFRAGTPSAGASIEGAVIAHRVKRRRGIARGTAFIGERTIERIGARMECGIASGAAITSPRQIFGRMELTAGIAIGKRGFDPVVMDNDLLMLLSGDY